MEGGRIATPQSDLGAEATVALLINRTSGWWNAHLIDRRFYLRDARLIKSLPLCSTPQPDILTWPKEKSGNYSVKSGYKLLCEWQNEELNWSQVSNVEKSFWTSIWKIKVPGKIKHFIWKACSNSLPTKENLMKLKILQEAVCQRCSDGGEDVLHSLWSCDKLQAVGEKDFGWAVRSGISLNSFFELLKLIQSKPYSVALFVATAWSVWYHRNKTHLNETTLPFEKITDFARDYIRDFKMLISIPPCSRPTV
nr:putative ribonuclease h protein [Quercus suber]